MQDPNQTPPQDNIELQEAAEAVAQGIDLNQPQLEEKLAARIATLEQQLAEQQANVLYVKAEGENIRRRAAEDIDKARKYALEKFSSELLAVKDSLDAALLVVESTDVASYKNGVELTAKQLSGVFEKFNIAEINPVGEKFDPNRHQAISTIEAEGEANTVLSVLQKGYTLNERVLRPALVMVIKAKSS